MDSENTTKKIISPNDLELLLKKFGVGYRPVDDPFFADGDKLEEPLHKVIIVSNRAGISHEEVVVDEEVLAEENVDAASPAKDIKSTQTRCTVPGCYKLFNNVTAYEIHYNLLHRFVCGQCHKNLPSGHMLDLHLSEKHDSFFAVQAERESSQMYACFLEACPHKSATPIERKDHCITDHNFPHTFHFDCGSTTATPKNKKLSPTNESNSIVDGDENELATKTEPNSNNKNNKDQKSASPPQKLKFFNFGHSNVKTFSKSSTASSVDSDHCYAKALTKNHKPENSEETPSDILNDSNKMVTDLMDSLPE